MNYLKDPDGNVYLESENPVQAWTPAEWRAFLSEVEAEIVELRQKLTCLPPRKTEPDGETLRFWNAMHGGHGTDLETQIEARKVLLEDLKKV